MITIKENVKTIKMNVGLLGDKKYKNITLEEFTKKWTDHTRQIHGLAHTVEDLKKIDKVQKIVRELAESTFNRTWENDNHNN
tara:strand:- start:35 stop:280 length:246 start_codon:yes stop_codon:yes gene_type:complete